LVNLNRGNCPTIDYIKNLNDSEKQKFLALINHFAEHGEIRNREKFRIEEKPIYAFKSFQLRVLCFFLPDMSKKTIVLTHAFKKKSEEMPKQEVERAKRIHNEVIGEIKKKGIINGTE
jgi:phage-related protein